MRIYITNFIAKCRSSSSPGTERHVQNGKFVTIIAALTLTMALAGIRETEGAIVHLTPVKDNTIYESVTALKSNGAGQSLFTGRNNNGSIIHRALIAFKVADTIPIGATINSATLTLWVNRTITAGSNVELHRVLADWGEGTSNGTGAGAPAQPGDATWLHTFFETRFWAAAGGDFSATASSVTSVGIQDSAYTWPTTPQMVADVQDWLNNPASDFGWLLKGEEVLTAAKSYDSRESANAAHRPTLTIDYTPPLVQKYSLSVSFAGSGSGTVTGTAQGFANTSCNKAIAGSCTPTFYPIGTQVSLSATPDWKSSFTTWGGVDSSLGSTASVIMNANRNIVADFSPVNRVKLLPISTTYASIQDAYNSAVSGSTIMARDFIFMEALLFDNSSITDITLNGGLDTTYQAVTGYSTIKGLSISSGKLIVSNIRLRQ